MALISPIGAIVPMVSAASLGFLALLGAIGARAGGANVLRATAPGDVLGGVGDGSDRRNWEGVRNRRLIRWGTDKQRSVTRDVRFWHKAGMPVALQNVRF